RLLHFGLPELAYDLLGAVPLTRHSDLPSSTQIVRLHLDPFLGVRSVLVNDGSKDRTHEACRLLCERFPGVVQYLRLAKNFGEHSAVKVVSLRVRTVRPGLPLPLGPRPADTMSRGFDVTVLQRTVSFPP
ncbi:MAG TPA: glycosyltransferase, partial [Acidobacteriota bacterium]|nr:glycosyltransferase [Acidobacteriota bacterium]